MGTLRGDNGGERPPEGGGVPDLPPEWGVIVIPDDAAELDDETTALRREWRREARVNRWRQRLGLAPVKIGGHTGSSLALPLLIMSIAIVATLTSLFALVWPNHPVRRTTGTQPSTATTAATLADVTLYDAQAKPVRLRDTLPAVILLVDGCDCGRLISAVASGAPTAVTVVAVARAAPSVPAQSPPGASADPAGQASGAPPATRVRALADPAGVLLSTFRSTTNPPGAAVALLVRKGGEIQAAPVITSFDQIRADLTQLN
jgi:hypothetical protein